MKKYLLVAFVILTAIVSCKKDGTKLSNLELLQAHQWKYSTCIQTDGTTTIDLFAQNDCESDDIYEFNKSMQVNVSTGTKRCYLGQGTTETDTYWLSKNQDSLYFQSGDVPSYIKSITTDKMIWETKLIKNGKNVVVTSEYLKN